MDRLRNVLGLLDDGKRVYQLKEGEVTRADFEYCVVLNQVLFGTKGLAETLGPTWQMIHDPRFNALEKVFVIKKQGKFGGDASVGLQRQQKDGTFDGQMAGMEQIAEILGEGRNMIDFLRSRAIIDAASELYPERSLRYNEKDSRSALKLVQDYEPAVNKIIVDKLTEAGKLIAVPQGAQPAIISAPGADTEQVMGVRSQVDAGDTSLPPGVTTVEPPTSTGPTVISAPEVSAEEIAQLRAHIDEAICDPDYTIVTNYEVKWIELSADAQLTTLFINTFGVEEFNKLGVFSPEERRAIIAKADSYQMYKPENFKFWPDDELWKIIFAEYTNYFFRDGRPNQMAINLHKLFKADLLGLIHDYAEVAHVQETVLLHDTNELYEPGKHGEAIDRVSMEVENLERGLTYRAELRVMAYQVLKHLGLAEQMPELTDFERDKLVQVIYTSDLIEKKAETVSNILSFLAGIKVSGQSVQEREFDQIAQATAESQRIVAGLKDGSIKPISRYTEEVVETAESTPEDAMIQRVFSNPVAMVVFSRLAGIEKRIEILSEEFSPSKKTAGGSLEGDDEGNRIPEDAERQKLLNDWIVSISQPSEFPYQVIPSVSDEDLAKLNAIEKLVRAQNVLRPVFEDQSFEWSDEKAAELLVKVEGYDPTPEQEVQQGPEGSDPGAPQTWVH